MKEFIANLITEGGRVFWTAVESAAGVIAAFNVPPTLFDFAGSFEPVLVAGVGVAVAAIATALKELARKRLTSE